MIVCLEPGANGPADATAIPSSLASLKVKIKLNSINHLQVALIACLKQILKVYKGEVLCLTIDHLVIDPAISENLTNILHIAE